MKKMRTYACALAVCAGLFETSPCRAESNAKPTFITFGTPMLKVNFRTSGVYAEPNFLPGPGFGYIWNAGAWGVVAYPSFGIFDRGDITLSPQVVFHAYLLSAGLGYELRFARTNNGEETRLFAAYPIVTVGLSLPIQAWWEKK